MARWTRLYFPDAAATFCSVIPLRGRQSRSDGNGNQTANNRSAQHVHASFRSDLFHDILMKLGLV